MSLLTLPGWFKLVIKSVPGKIKYYFETINCYIRTQNVLRHKFGQSSRNPVLHDSSSCCTLLQLATLVFSQNSTASPLFFSLVGTFYPLNCLFNKSYQLWIHSLLDHAPSSCLPLLPNPFPISHAHCRFNDRLSAFIELIRRMESKKVEMPSSIGHPPLGRTKQECRYSPTPHTSIARHTGLDAHFYPLLLEPQHFTQLFSVTFGNNPIVNCSHNLRLPPPDFRLA